MNAKVIKVAFANSPKAGKKQATIKTDEGEIFGVWPDKFGLFRPGCSYRVEFAIRPYQGKDYKTITKCEPLEETPRERPVVESAYAAEREFVTTILAAGVKACTIATNEAALVEATRMLRSVYRKALAP